jgi:hypothetical protein
MYNRLLGRDGEKMLPDEIKWLAVTHKSFDYGRRGFNTKLAYFGRLRNTLGGGGMLQSYLLTLVLARPSNSRHRSD